MRKRYLVLVTVLLVAVLMLGACSALSAAQSAAPALSSAGQALTPTAIAPSTPAPGVSAVPSVGSVQDMQSLLEQIYTNVNPSVVLIEVSGSTTNVPSNSNPFGIPQGRQFTQGLGSGFVWDTNGDIVTNNHVVDGASTITVTFADGTIVTGQVVGPDPYSDLAVVKVSAPAAELHPVQVADSTQVKVGQLAVAIGNPFGEQNTMTSGIISALGRALPATGGNPQGGTYQIPDVIQTDAPINPGNSGGVLLNAQGQVIGVTAAIESGTQSSAGIGFAIPSAIVQKVIPALIQSGHYDHPYLGVSGTDLTPDLAKAMNLAATQRGALVETVTPGGPADKAGLKGSTQSTTIQGQSANVGGDVVTAFNGQQVKTFDDLVAALEHTGQIGQNATLTILRNGQPQTITVTVGARPASQTTAAATPAAPSTTVAPVRLGITGLALTPQIAQAMNLPSNQAGVLVEQVQAGSAAQRAGLQGSTNNVTINGNSIQVGGDVITALNGTSVASVAELQAALQQIQPGQTATLTVLRNGTQMNVQVTF